MRTFRLKSLLLVGTVALFAAGCSESNAPVEPIEEPAPYGYFYLGEGEIPVTTFTCVDEGPFLL
jgi:hypothetical protein